MADGPTEVEVPEYDGDLPSDPLQALAEIGSAVAAITLTIRGLPTTPAVEREVAKQVVYIAANMRTLADAIEPGLRSYREFERSMRSLRTLSMVQRLVSDHPTLNVDWNVKDGTDEPPC